MNSLTDQYHAKFKKIQRQKKTKILYSPQINIPFSITELKKNSIIKSKNTIKVGSGTV